MKSSPLHKKSVTPTSKNLLSLLPDWSNWKDADRWIAVAKKKTRRLKGANPYLAMKWSDLQEKKKAPNKNKAKNKIRLKQASVFEYFSDPLWRRFVMGVFLADLVSYPQAADQVRFDQLVVAMHRFPEGFTLWWMKMDDQWWPSGYSAWIPMQKTQFDTFNQAPETLADRIVSPVCLQNNPLVYLFNFSVAPLLKKSSFSKALMKDYVKSLKEARPSGLSCITVSEDGARIAKRLGMRKTGSFKIETTTDEVYCTPKGYLGVI